MRKPLWTVTGVFLLAFPAAGQNLKPRLPETTNTSQVFRHEPQRARISVKSKDEWVSPLIWAVELGRTIGVRALLEKGADVNAARKDGVTALMIAASAGDRATVRYLLEKGANVNAKDEDQWTPLFSAAFAGRTDIVRTLVDKGANINDVDRVGQTALMVAAVRGHTDTVCALAQSGIDVNVKDKEGRTALMYAADLGRTDTVRALLETGVDTAARNAEGATALQLAQKNHYSEIVALLSRAAMQGGKPLSTSVVADAAAVQALLQKEADVDGRSGRTADAGLAQDQQAAEKRGTTERTELSQVPPGQAIVTYLDGVLTIRASNALLGDILNSVCEKMGAVLDLPSVPNERIFAILGPGRPREVLSSLLNNAQLDFALVASADDPSALDRVIVFSRTKDSGVRERMPENQIAQSRVSNNESSQPDAKPRQEAPAMGDSPAQQVKEALAQVRAEIANSADTDPEIMRLLDEQLKAAAAAPVDPAQIASQAGTSAPASPVGRPRHRRR